MMNINNVISWLIDNWKTLVSICAFFGIAIDITPYIKFNPVKWILCKIGRMLNHELLLEIDNIKSENKRIENENDQRRIKDLRYKILDFSSSLGKRQRDLEEFDVVYELFDEYEMLLGKYDLTNGKVTRAMSNIENHYNSLCNDQMQ